MSAGELVVMFAVTLGGVAVMGMLIAVLLLWFRHAIKQVALLLTGVGQTGSKWKTVAQTLPS